MVEALLFCSLRVILFPPFHWLSVAPFMSSFKFGIDVCNTFFTVDTSKAIFN